MQKRWTIRTVRDLAGLDPHFDLFTAANLEFALALIKEKIVDARRADDEPTASNLSRAKAFLKKRYINRISRTCECGTAKSQHSQHCQPCALRNKSYKNSIMEKTPIVEHEIETALLMVSAIRQAKGGLARVIDRMATDGQIGDSFVTSKQSTTVTTLARMRGLKVICRLLDPDEKNPKGPKKRKYRVWRCDGLEMEEVNEIIRKRLAGEPVRPAEPCVVPTPEELEALKRSRWGNRKFTGGRPPLAAETLHYSRGGRAGVA